MPVYSFSPPFFSLAPGEQVQVWNAQQPTPGNVAGAISQQLALVRLQTQNGTPFNVSGYFSGAPGTFEIDVMVSDDDNPAHYQTIANGNITTVDATNNTFHLDGILVSASFVALFLRTRTNAVNVTAWIGR